MDTAIAVPTSPRFDNTTTATNTTSITLPSPGIYHSSSHPHHHHHGESADMNKGKDIQKFCIRRNQYRELLLVAKLNVPAITVRDGSQQYVVCRPLSYTHVVVVMSTCVHKNL